jgi:hypothetical protein
MNTSIKNCKGQALVEVILVSGLLVVLFALAALLSKISDIRWQTSLASRTLAFDCATLAQRCTNLPANASVVDDLRRRHFGDPRRPVMSNDALDAAPSGADLRAFWQDRKAAPLIASMSDVGATVNGVNFDAWSGALGRSGGAAVGQVMQAGPSRFGLNLNEGLIRGRVQADIAAGGPSDFRSQLDRLALNVVGQTAILGDSWTASGPGDRPDLPTIAETSVANRVNKGKDIPVISAFVRLANKPLIAFMQVVDFLGLEPNGREFKYQSIDMDIIPLDRRSE